MRHDDLPETAERHCPRCGNADPHRLELTSTIALGRGMPWRTRITCAACDKPFIFLEAPAPSAAAATPRTCARCRREVRADGLFVKREWRDGVMGLVHLVCWLPGTWPTAPPAKPISETPSRECP